MPDGLKRHNRMFLLEEEHNRNNLSGYWWNICNMPVIPVAQHQETRQFMISTVQFSLSLWPDDWACLVLFQQQCFRKWHPGFCSEQIQTLCGFFEGERVKTSQPVLSYWAPGRVFFVLSSTWSVLRGRKSQTTPQQKSCPSLFFMLTFSWDEGFSYYERHWSVRAFIVSQSMSQGEWLGY